MLSFFKKSFFLSLLVLLTTFGCITGQDPSKGSGGFVIVPPPNNNDDILSLPTPIIPGSDLSTDIRGLPKASLYDVLPSIGIISAENIGAWFGDTYYFSDKNDAIGTKERAKYITGVNMAQKYQSLITFNVLFPKSGNKEYIGKQGCLIVYDENQNRITFTGGDGNAIGENIFCDTFLSIGSSSKEVEFQSKAEGGANDQHIFTMVQYVGGDSIDKATAYFLLPPLLTRWSNTKENKSSL